MYFIYKKAADRAYDAFYLSFYSFGQVTCGSACQFADPQSKLRQELDDGSAQRHLPAH
jgi:hypothetical protein